MEQSVGLEDLFDFAEVLLGAVNGTAGQQNTHVGVVEIFLD